MRKTKQKKSDGTLTRSKKTFISKKNAVKVKDIITSTILKEIY